MFQCQARVSSVPSPTPEKAKISISQRNQATSKLAVASCLTAEGCVYHYTIA